MKAIGFRPVALVWMACAAAASGSPYDPRLEYHFVSAGEKLVLAGEPGYRFRGGDIITPSGEEWTPTRNGEAAEGFGNYTFRPRREKKSTGKPATPEVVERPAYRAVYDGYLQPPLPAMPYYPIDPYLPYATTTPESGAWSSSGGDTPWGLATPFRQ